MVREERICMQRQKFTVAGSMTLSWRWLGFRLLRSSVFFRCEVIWSVLPFVEDFNLFIDVYCISPMWPMRFFFCTDSSLVVMS